MPLHKSSRAPRLDPTMISAPLGDFRHTMHIGRGGDAFGDTSFLSKVDPSSATPDQPAAEPELAVNHSGLHTDVPGSPEDNQLKRSDSESSLTLDLDLDLDLGPSMLGDVLGVMDGLALDSNSDNVLSPQSGSFMEVKQYKGDMKMATKMDVNGDGTHAGDGRIPDENGIKPKGLRPKVRFSDKREEIIRQASEEDEGRAFDCLDEDPPGSLSPTRGETQIGEAKLANHKVDLPPSPASSHSSAEDAPLDRRRLDSGHSETDSEEEEEEAGRGYTFEDEFDDEIGL
ncbi:cdc42 effector protein 5 [Oryzias melastigma]|uniref:cdc42 effector protein 5 n=1 Tax=Oryzias melastigma TaxID=30732 RepID=UPI000CF832E7|nr:cdc42 effector protein 5 [Oryzias melastigma]XP_024123059.1 cdc42 effector protein 5 [Oryzias melastigma]